METLPQAIKERSRVPGSCTRRKAAPSQGLFQSQVAQLGQEDRALHRPSSTLVKAEAEEGLLAPIFAWPGAPAPEASQGASCPRSSHPASLLRGASKPALRRKTSCSQAELQRLFPSDSRSPVCGGSA